MQRISWHQSVVKREKYFLVITAISTPFSEFDESAQVKQFVLFREVLL